MQRSDLQFLLPPAHREPVRELYHFFRWPLSLHDPDRSAGSTVVLYGLPFSGWNRHLAARALWDGVPGVSRVVRMPAMRGLLQQFAEPDAVVIPMKEAHTHGLPFGVRRLAPRPEVVHVLDDKQRFAAYVAANGLGGFCPRTYATLTEAVFPCVVKRTDCVAGQGISVVWSRDEAEALLKSPLHANKPYVLQEAIPGTKDYCTCCVFKDGRLLWSRTFENEIATPLTIRRGGENVLQRRSIATREGIARQIETVLAPLSYSGPCNVDYKLEGERIRIFEVNARLAGSLLDAPFHEHLQAAFACIVAHSTRM